VCDKINRCVWTEHVTLLIVNDLCGTHTASELMAIGGPSGAGPFPKDVNVASPTRSPKVKDTWRYSPRT